MSRTKKGKKGPGHEYWGKRALSVCPPGKVSKDITNGKERASARKLKSALKKTDKLPDDGFGKDGEE
jgi:hypothetical protein